MHDDAHTAPLQLAYGKQLVIVAAWQLPDPSQVRALETSPPLHPALPQGVPDG